MYVLGNPILGKMFRGTGLVLTPESLCKEIRTSNDKVRLVLTNDPAKILELIDIDYNSVKDLSDTDMFPHYLASEYFKLSEFTQEPKDGKPLLLAKFSEFLKDYSLTATVRDNYKAIRTARVSEVLGISNLKDQFENAKRILKAYPSHKQKKVQGKYFLPFLGDYDVRNFEEDFKRFNDSFLSLYERKEFVVDHSLEEIVERFKETSAIDFSQQEVESQKQ